jgi:membrane-associated phospholipid phosphatase
LEDDARSAVLDHAMQSQFTVKPGQEVGVVRAANTDLVILRPPGEPDLSSQLTFIKSAADLRSDRLPEIHVQQTDILSFFGTLGYLHPIATKWTLDILEAVLRLCAYAEMPLKAGFDIPRSIGFAQQVQPILQVPTHGSWPSGHATEAFAVATVFGALITNGEVPTDIWAGADDAVHNRAQVMRLAHRIATNRTVAGLHFPTDSMAGAFLGISIGEYLIAKMSNSGDHLKSRTYDASNWRDDFTLVTLDTALRANNVDSGNAPIAGGIEDRLLHEIWVAAQNEW